MGKQTRKELISALKQLIIDECDRDVKIDEITDSELLFGADAPLQLDSLDALQLSVALQKEYGVRLIDSKETRRVMSNIATLADYLSR